MASLRPGESLTCEPEAPDLEWGWQEPSLEGRRED